MKASRIAGLLMVALLALAGIVVIASAPVAQAQPPVPPHRPVNPPTPDMSHKGAYPAWAQNAPLSDPNAPRPAHAPGHLKKDAPPPTETPGDVNRGWWLQPLTNSNPLKGGLNVHMSTNRTWDLRPSTVGIADRSVTQYAPTNYYPHGCLEIVNVGSHIAGRTDYSHGVGFWDWCSDRPGGDGTGGWQSFWWWDSTKVARYAYFDTGYNQEMYYAYIMHVSSSPNCWEGYVWAASANTWDLQATSCTTDTTGSTVADGWTAFEAYGMGNANGGARFCPAIPGGNPIRADDMQIWDGGQWLWMAATNHPLQMNTLDTTTTTVGCFSVSTESAPYYWHAVNPFNNASDRDWKVGNGGP